MHSTAGTKQSPLNLKRPLRLGRVLAAAFALSAGGIAAEPIADPKAFPRSAPPSLEKSHAAIEVRSGLKLELVASEPHVMNPIAMSFDEDGRLFVVEMLDYPLAAMRPSGRIRRLEDTDGDGKYDQSTIYADKLGWPSSVLCYAGGVFVAATPDLLYLRDVDGDGKADVREVAFTGFGEGATPLKSGQLFNSLCWGPDNRIYGAGAGNAGRIRRPDALESSALDLRSKDFSFDPRTWDLRAETGTGQFGMSFDDFGRRFMSSNHEHLRVPTFDYRYAERNTLVDFPSPLVDIPVDGGAAEIFKISPEEPWRVIRMKWRIDGMVRGGVEAGGRTSGYFTSACGATIYRGDALGPVFYGNAFVADPSNNIAHRKLVREEGTGFVAERPPDEKRIEFVRSRDVWFRPVNFATAPDGTLYIADMCRELIEDPMTIPEGITQHLDLANGNSHGRIYRVIPAGGFKQPAAPRLSKASPVELVGFLEHANGWYRDTASRLLYERQDLVAVPALETLARQGKKPAARVAALTALRGLARLSDAHVLAALADPDAHVREHAVRLAEHLVLNAHTSAMTTAGLRQAVQALHADSAPRIRLQVAFTTGVIGGEAVQQALLEIARRDASDALVRVAILSSIGDKAVALLSAVGADRELSQSEGGRALSGQLLKLIGARGQSNELQAAVAFIAGQRGQSAAPGWINAFGQGLRRANLKLATVDRDKKLDALLGDALRVASDRSAPATDRVSAIQLAGMSSANDVPPALLALISPAEPQVVQAEAVITVGRSTSPSVAGELLARWSGMTPRVREEATRILLARPERTLQLLEAINAGRLKTSDLSLAQQSTLRRHTDAKVSELANTLFRAATNRQKVVDDFLPALDLRGDATRGKQVYLNACQGCHRLGTAGFEVGPDLATVKSGGKEKLLTSIFDPNREVDSKYTFFKFETKDAGTLLGAIVEETPGAIVVRQAYGTTTTLARPNVISMESVGQSMMPEGLEQTLSKQDVADLLEYVLNSEP